MANEAKASLVIQLKDLVTAGLGKLGEKVEELGEQLEKSKFVWASLFGGIVSGVGLSLKAFGEEERALASLTAALKNQGIISTAVINDLKAHAAALQALTGVQDDHIFSAEALLVQFGITGNQLKEVTKLTLDFAAAKNVDLSSAANLIGKAFAGETAMLARYGIVIDETLPVQQKFAEALRQITISMGGRAQAEAETFIGSINKLKASFSDLQESIGARFAPALSALTLNLLPLIEKVKNFVDRNADAIVKVTIFVGVLTGLMTTAAAVAFAFAALTAAFGALLGPIGLVATAVAGLTAYWIGGTEAFENFKNSISNNADAIEARIREKVEAIKALEQEEADFKAQMEYQKTLGASLSYSMQEQAAQAAFDKQAELDRARADLDVLHATKKKAVEDKARADKLLAEQAANAKLLAEEQRANAIAIQEKAARHAAEVKMQDLTNQYIMFGFDVLRAGFHGNAVALFYISKAAAIAQALINTAVAVTQALALGPFGWGMIPWIKGLGALQVGLIAGTTIAGFAEGGMVLPTAGGTIARIGEAGSKEAVIPLNDSESTREIRDALGGGGTTVNINAGVLVTDDESMRELAKMLDEKLFELRRNRESVSF